MPSSSPRAPHLHPSSGRRRVPDPCAGVFVVLYLVLWVQGWFGFGFVAAPRRTDLLYPCTLYVDDEEPSSRLGAAYGPERLVREPCTDNQLF